MAKYTRAGADRTSSERTIPATEAAKNFGQLVNRVRETSAVYTIERGGVPVAQIGPVVAFHCTVADLVAALKSGRRLDEKYLRTVEAGVKAANRPAVPRNPWAR